MKILITGGRGFVGSCLVRRLLESGHDVRTLDILEPQVHGRSTGGIAAEAPADTAAGAGVSRSWAAPAHPDADNRVGDVRDPRVVAECLEGIEAVVHLAAQVGVGQSMYEMRRYLSHNVAGTGSLLDGIIASRRDIARLIIASSMSVYGEGRYHCGRCGDRARPAGRPRPHNGHGFEPVCSQCGGSLKPLATDEGSPLGPCSVYAISKRDQEELGLLAGAHYGLPVTALRFFNIYGPGQSLENPYTGVLAIFASRLVLRRPPIIFEDGQQLRDFLHVTDAARAISRCLEVDAAVGQVFNVGTGSPVSVLDAARQLSRLLDGEEAEAIVTGRSRAGDVRHCYADAGCLAKLTGFRARISFEQGMADLANWVRDRAPRDLLEAALDELSRRGLTRQGWARTGS